MAETAATNPTGHGTTGHGQTGQGTAVQEATRRDFLTLLTAAAGVVAAGAILWPVIDALNPDAASESAAHPIINIADIAAGTARTVQWAGLPITIRKLSAQEIDANKFVVPSSLPDPAGFDDRVNAGYPDFVVVIGLNTATPCALEGDAAADPRGDFGGWVCPCDGSEYDPLGRVRKGPATSNLAIPRYSFLNAAQIELG